MGGAEEWAPTGSFWGSARKHVCFGGKLIGFARVAWNAGSHHIVPAGAPPFVSGDDVVEIEFLGLEGFGAVLANVVVSAVDVLSREFYLFLGQAVEEREDDDLGEPDLPGDGADDLVIG